MFGIDLNGTNEYIKIRFHNYRVTDRWGKPLEFSSRVEAETAAAELTRSARQSAGTKSFTYTVKER